ncbi:MAG: restriction endonuclease subunit S [Acidobacteriota bacterium]
MANGELPDGWEALPFDECVLAPLERRRSVQQNAYAASGTYPVVDQGEGMIAGYTDDPSAVYRDSLPMILFGDHTRNIKYLDFPFATGADGTKLFIARPGKLEPKYLYFALRALDIPSRGYNRHFKYLREQIILAPQDMSEQETIAGVLSKLQRAVEAQDKIIATLKDLKAATLAKLFREGLRGEPLKETEIGEIPESWEVVPLRQVTASSAFGPRFSAGLYSQDGNIATLRTTDINEDGHINYSSMPKATLQMEKFKAHVLSESDLLITRSGTCGIAAVFASQPIPVLPGAFLIRVRLTAAMVPHILRLWINSPIGRSHIQQLAAGAVQQNISGTRLAGLLIPLPKEKDQVQIAATLMTIEKKLEECEGKRDILRVLFSTSLHLLMAGEVRVTPLMNGALS